jgi:hypothetical protein
VVSPCEAAWSVAKAELRRERRVRGEQAFLERARATPRLSESKFINPSTKASGVVSSHGPPELLLSVHASRQPSLDGC